MWGHWRIGVAHGRWLITFWGGVTDTAAIHELVPTACP
jgi:hypothetical protein